MIENYDYKEEPYKPNWVKTIIRCLTVVVSMAFLLWLLTGCADDDGDPVAVDRVLLVYLAGDNNLSGESHDKLRAIARGYDGSAGQRVLVYKDSRDEAACLYEADGRGAYTAIESYGDENSADAEVFARVIAKARAMYPGASFNLLVFSHASGWLPAGSLGNPGLRSVLVDDEDQMEFRDFAGAIPEGMFGLIAFDACHMAGIEVAYELRGKAQYIAASSAEVLSPGFTPVYERYTGDLIRGDYEGFMRQAFGFFDGKEGYMRSATFSVISTGGLEELSAFVKQHCDFTKEVQLSDIQHFDRGRGYLFCDFGDYYSRLLETELEKQQLQQLIGNCVAWKASTPSFLEGYNGFAIIAHSGMTGYIPQGRYPVLNEAYRHLQWKKAIDKGY